MKDKHYEDADQLLEDLEVDGPEDEDTDEESLFDELFDEEEDLDELNLLDGLDFDDIDDIDGTYEDPWEDTCEGWDSDESFD